MKPLAENLWLLRYRLPVLGKYLGRNVTVVRLTSGELVIHSTAPFSPADVAAVSALGRPAFLVEGITLHDTFAKAGRAAFPDARYFAPRGFSKVAGLPTEDLAQPPVAWANELDVLEIAGKPKAREHAFFHRPSRTLIVTDLLFNITAAAPLGVRLYTSVALHGGRNLETAMPRLMKLVVADREVFTRSVTTMLAWDFDRVIFGHGEVVKTGGKTRVAGALRAAGFPVELPGGG